jgi:putative SbcD/Mre11-related phosphoesterase
MDHQGWHLTPEGAAVRSDASLAVIADVHLGYEWARGAGGDTLPAHSLAETVAKLGLLLERHPITRLVVAGDLVESPAPCRRTAEDVRRLAAWLDGRGIAMMLLRGNHDPRRQVPLPETFEVGEWTIGHGDRPIPGRRVVFGHHHPALKAEGRSFPCFLVGPTTLALPAFSPNAAGLDVASGLLPPTLAAADLRCVACAEDELLDFGPLPALVAALRRP